jgi:hypothetical protein
MAGTATFASGAVDATIKNHQQSLYKSSSHDGESSTLATADETDKSDTSSSWSRTDSPTTYPGMATNFAFSNLDRARAVHSCPPPGAENSALTDEDENFIFEMDM